MINKNFLLLIIVMMSIISLTTAQQTTLGTFKQNDCVNLIQSCDNCTYTNITQVNYPNSTIAISNKVMTKSGFNYNYSFCSTKPTGDYIVYGVSDLDGKHTVWAYNFMITPSGKESWFNFTSLMLLFLLGSYLVVFISWNKNEYIPMLVGGLFIALFSILAINNNLGELIITNNPFYLIITYFNLALGLFFSLGAGLKLLQEGL